MPNVKKRHHYRLSTRKSSLDMVASMYPWSSPLFPGSSPPPSTSPSPLWPLLPGMLILFPIVSSSLWTGNGWSPRIHTQGGAGRKWSHCSTCNQEIEQPQQGGGRTGRERSHTHIYTNKHLTHKHPLTSPTAVGTGTTTQETECEQSAQTHKRSSSLLRYYHCLFNLHTHRN